MNGRRASLLALLLTISPQTEGADARYVELLDWRIPHVARALATDSAHFPGVPGSAAAAGAGSFRTAIPAQAKRVDGRQCTLGQLLAFDVEDAYAFDVDETVTVTVTFAAEYSSPFYVAWDKSGGTGAGISAEIVPSATPGFQTATIPLERARLAGHGAYGTDIAIGSRNGVMLCDLGVARSHTTRRAEASGTVRLAFEDAATGRAVPARVGLYDRTGRAPLPSGDALAVQRFTDELRLVAVDERTFWPSENRLAFYVDGRYEARLPVGRYELVATRGPEYRAWRGEIEVRAGAVTQATVALERFADLPVRGWYSGDVDLHATRVDARDDAISGVSAAEDVHVASVLEMSNIGSRYFEQGAEWGEAGRFARDGYFVVTGQEGPRTGHLGHTIHLGLKQPIRPAANEYLLYDKTFEEARRQNSVSGFAHMGWSRAEGQEPQMNRGLTLLAPTGLVSFVEILQAGRFETDAWYRLLNLGYRIAPAAGSDWPYGGLPGAARTYVKLEGAPTPEAWLAALRAGNAYVSSGPFLELTVNGKRMGQELHAGRGTALRISAVAELNPDVDALARLELVVLGDVLVSVPAEGRDRIAFDTTVVADRSQWIAVRSFGMRDSPDQVTVAHSAPVYVVVDDEPTWKRGELPQIVGDLRFQLSRMLNEEIPPIVNAGPEPWETRAPMAEQWLLQRLMLKPRIDRAEAAYRGLIADFEALYGPRSGTAGARPFVLEKIEEEHDH
jgi:hypothetical protein